MNAAVAMVLLLFAAATACLGAGTLLLVGAAWALIVLGALLLVAALTVRAGLKLNG